MNTKLRTGLTALALLFASLALAGSPVMHIWDGGGASPNLQAQNGVARFGPEQHLEVLDSGASLPLCLSIGREVVLVVDGELTVYLDTTRGELRDELLQTALPEELPRHLSSQKQVYRAGESFIVPTGQYFHFCNEGVERTTYAQYELFATTNPATFQRMLLEQQLKKNLEALGVLLD